MAHTQILVRRWGPQHGLQADSTRGLGRFPVVKTDKPAHSHLNENFTFNQN